MMSTIPELTSALWETVPSNQPAAQPFPQDRSGFDPQGSPLAVVETPTVEDVQAACTIAQKHSLPIVASGANIGYSGRASAGSGSTVRTFNPGKVQVG